jgi:hypothetical protein
MLLFGLKLLGALFLNTEIKDFVIDKLDSSWLGPRDAFRPRAEACGVTQPTLSAG